MSLFSYAIITFVILFILQGAYRQLRGNGKFDALPPHIDSPEDWNGKDDDKHSYTQWRKAIKGWFAFGPRSEYFWARWRRYPITLFACFGKGESRWENDFMALRSVNKHVVMYRPNGGFYLSRVQYWCDWSVQVQWPLFIGVHWYTDEGKKGWQFYIGCKKDTDAYWFPAIFFGRCWK